MLLNVGVSFTMTLAPIALFVYNRPVHARRTIEALLRNPEARDSELYVFSDGAKDERASPKVDEVRRMLAEIRGFRAVHVVARERNLGLSASIVSGVGALCRDHGRAIVMEDDLLTSPGFLRFINESLIRYADNSLVMQVSGHMYPVVPEGSTRARFLPLTTCWGWGTWKRAWDAYDPDMGGFSALANDRALRRRFNLDGAYNYFALLRKQRAGTIDSWGVRWLLSVFMSNGLVLYPPQTFVENIGFDGSGTHGVDLGEEERGVDRILPQMPDAPAAISVDAETFEAVKQHLKRSHRGVRAWLARRFGL